jgi:hypothetical protein
VSPYREEQSSESHSYPNDRRYSKDIVMLLNYTIFVQPLKEGGIEQKGLPKNHLGCLMRVITVTSVRQQRFRRGSRIIRPPSEHCSKNANIDLNASEMRNLLGKVDIGIPC